MKEDNLIILCGVVALLAIVVMVLTFKGVTGDVKRESKWVGGFTVKDCPCQIVSCTEYSPEHSGLDPGTGKILCKCTNGVVCEG